MRTLRKGAQGQDVSRVQHFLVGQHLYTGEADGRFGPITEMAVVAYQAREQLTADGWIGAKTYARMIAQGLDVIQDAELEWPPPPEWLKPLTNNEERMRRWGRFEYKPAPTKSDPEGITILGDWEDRHIVQVTCPVFGRPIQIHKACSDDYLAFMTAVREAKLQHLLLHYDGSFSARFIRGSRTRLSNHAWGTAFDVNAEWNGLGQTPAYRGQKGSVRELVPIANKHNWYWGGHFKFRRDGMHFEHV